MKCFWCNVDPKEAFLRHEGPHLTWCIYFRESQRGGRKCSECNGSGRTDNHVTGEVECSSCEGTGIEGAKHG